MLSEREVRKEKEIITLWGAIIGGIAAMLMIIAGLVGMLEPKSALLWAMAVPAPIGFVALAFIEKYREDRREDWRERQLAAMRAREAEQEGIVISNRPTAGVHFSPTPDPLIERWRKEILGIRRYLQKNK